MTTPHPLQAALDRSAKALFTATDLLEIAQTRKTPGGRSDARQESLYRAIVTAAVGVIEEATEALVIEALSAQSLQPKAMEIIQSAVSRLMQNPNSEGIRNLMEAFVGFNPIPHLTIQLRTAAPGLKNPKTVKGRTSRELWNFYNQDRIWSGVDAAEVLDRFVRIRHSFAHQDSSGTVLSKSETNLLRTKLAIQKPTSQNEIDIIMRLNATCAIRVLSPTAAKEDPVDNWRLHETHAVNALLTTAGVVASMTDGLADYLQSTSNIQRAAHEPLALSVESGRWVTKADAGLSNSPCGVNWVLTKYAPLSRN